VERIAKVFAALGFLAALSACSGGGSSPPHTQGTPTPVPSGVTPTPAGATPTPAGATPTPGASATPHAPSLVAVGSAQSHTVSLFPPTANGTVTPVLLTLPSGSIAPFAVAFDAAGDLFVGVVAPGSVVEYAPGATAASAPIRTIVGGATELSEPNGVGVDGAGNIYVSNAGSAAITVYAPGANGDVAPIRAIAGGATDIGVSTNFLQSLTVDTAGTIYAAVATDLRLGGVLVFAAGASGNVAPATTLNGTATGLDGPIAIALDANRNLYAINSNGNTVIVFAAGAKGDAAPLRTFSSGAFIDEPAGLAVDGLGNIYVSSQVGGIGGSYSVFPPSSSGIGVPTYTVTAAGGVLDQAYGIAVR
jgi:sugar lactone lactonase YvrE